MAVSCDMRGGATRFEQRDLRIFADLAMLKDARDWAAGAAEDFGMAEEEAFQVKLAASEAVTNAIVHGSTSRKDQVSLEAREESGALVFEVRDSGADGVGPSRAKSGETSPVLAEGGRGLELVEMVMDEVELTRRCDGSVLRFAKRPAEAA